MADADRNPISGLDPVYFPTGAVLERPVTDRPTHDTIDAIIDWLAGPAHHNSLSLADEFDESHGECSRQVCRYCGRPFTSARCIRNISAQTSSGGGPPVGPC
jgi:hypothetical protein